MMREGRDWVGFGPGRAPRSIKTPALADVFRRDPGNVILYSLRIFLYANGLMPVATVQHLLFPGANHRMLCVVMRV